MSLQQRRAAMIERLGPYCAKCGSTEELQIDHRFGRTWRFEDFTHTEAMSKLEQEERDGLLRVLCARCNRQDGARKKNQGFRHREPHTGILSGRKGRQGGDRALGYTTPRGWLQ